MMKISKRRIWLLVSVVTATCVLRYIYASWAVDVYAYQGFTRIDVTAQALVVQILLLIVTVFLMPLRIDRPSDFFFMFYTWFVLLPAAAFYAASGYVGEFGAIVLYAILAFPCIAIASIRKIPIKLPVAPFIPEKMLVAGVLSVSGIVFAIAYLQGIKFSLEFDAMYERRMIGRDVIGSRNLFAYAFAATINGFVPFLGLLGGYKRSLMLGGVAVFIAVAGFAAIGTKSPVAVSILFFALGWLQSEKMSARLPGLFASLMVALILTAVLLFQLIANSFLIDVFLRRSFFTTASNIGIYWDLVSSYSAQEIFLSRKNFGVPITFYVGEHYYGNSASNININAFLLAFADSGLVWYLLSIVGVGIFFAAVDYRFKNSGYVGYMLLGAMYGLLLSEQAWTTALASSGAILLFIILSCVKFTERSANRSFIKYRPSGVF